MLTIEHRRYPITYTVKLNEWWCDCGEFQALHLPCSHVIIVCSFCHLQVYEVQFNPVRNQDYWSTYTGPNFLPYPIMRRHQSGRPSTQRIRNEMDDSISNKPKKC
uniref:SWIM-type domain-containing protein n=1 Tax=Phaseolus vulgaris TaxID=3885 RepID=V7AZD7_PHAVU|nr:hypothetical protein PHAVU_009G225900g [Phaseolus vulgaris]ESW10635.1 hypothetical protein PHAVU_009G225900g [Phaseolus vulgaris]